MKRILILKKTFLRAIFTIGISLNQKWRGMLMIHHCFIAYMYAVNILIISS